MLAQRQVLWRYWWTFRDGRLEWLSRGCYGGMGRSQGAVAGLDWSKERLKHPGVLCLECETTAGKEGVTAKQDSHLFYWLHFPAVWLLMQVYFMVIKSSTSLSIIFLGGGCTLILMNVSSYKFARMVINHMHRTLEKKKKNIKEIKLWIFNYYVILKFEKV